MSDYAKDVLVDADWVQEHLNDENIRIVEVDENPALYAEAHIQGAIGFDWKEDLQDQVRRDFLGPEAFGELFGSRGISDEHTIVLYGDRNNWFAAYTYWYLKYYGHHEVLLLNGPREKWIADGRPTTAEVPAYPPETFTAKPGDDDDPGTARGGPGCARLAHEAGRRALAGGVRRRDHLACGLRAGGGAARGPHPGRRIGPVGAGGPRGRHVQVRARSCASSTAARACSNGEDIIAYCRIGERSAHTWFVLHELLGHERVKNYDGSWTEWGNLVGVPVETGA